MNDHAGAAPNRHRKPRKGPGRPPAGESLTPHQVAEAAFQLVAAEGEQALTMRRLGGVLGVKAMALYNHFPDKEAILDAVASTAFTRVPPVPAKGPWKGRIKAICRGIRSMALEYPNVFRVAMTRPVPPSSALPQIEVALAAFQDAGLAPAAQAVAYHTTRLYVRAFCLWEFEEFRGAPAADPAELARATAPFPRAHAASALVFAPNPEVLFEAGLDLILRGLQVQKQGPAQD